MNSAKKKDAASSKTTENKADNRECNGVDAKCFFNDDSCNRQYNKNLLYSLVQAEAGNQDLDGCRLVADVVLNRIDSDRFPNELEDVIYAPGQFSVVRNGRLASAKPTDKVIQAVNMELSQGRLNTDVLYFNNKPNGGTKYGDHYFK